MNLGVLNFVKLVVRKKLDDQISWLQKLLCMFWWVEECLLDTNRIEVDFLYSSIRLIVAREVWAFLQSKESFFKSKVSKTKKTKQTFIFLTLYH